MKAAGVLSLLSALAAGAATVFGFAPFALSALPLLTLALLFVLWLWAPSPRAAAAVGFAFGLGLFGAGASWVYIALNTFGGMPLPLAAVGTAGFCAFLALYPALRRLARDPLDRGGRSASRAVAAAAAWTLAEWARSVVFTGFPWLSLGYAQLPAGTAVRSPATRRLGGVFLVTLAMALAAGALALAVDAIAAPARARATALFGDRRRGRRRRRRRCCTIEWTAPAGAPVAVSLVQGNVLQELKFDPAFRASTFDLYLRPRRREPRPPRRAAGERVSRVRRRGARAGVPPDRAHDGGARRRRAGRRVHRRAAARPAGPTRATTTASSASARRSRSSTASATSSRSAKRSRWSPSSAGSSAACWRFRSRARRAAGPTSRRSLVAGQRVAVNICYEDAFGADIRRQAADATLLVNVTNDAWYGRSLAAEQHNQIAAMRALETGRPLLRATNTGITSAIDHDGREIARLPWFTRGILEVEIAGRQGATPYVRWGDAPACVLAALLLAAAIAQRRRARRDGA